MSGAGRFWTLEVKAIAAAVVITAILVLLRSSRRSPEVDEDQPARPSTFLADGSGARALYLAAEELGIQVGRRMLPWGPEGGAGDDDLAALAVIAPDEPLLPSEGRWLREWVLGGGRLFYVPTYRSGRDAVLEALGVPPLRRGEDQVLGSFTHPRQGSFGKAKRTASPEAELLLRGCPPAITDVIAPPLRVQLGEPEGCEPLYGEDGEAAAALFRVGSGWAVVLSDPSPLLNRRLRESEATPLALRALAFIAEGGRLWFDELHHGFDARGGLGRAAARFLAGTSPGWAVLEAAAIAVAALVFAGVRLGSPIESPPARRRSPLEHVEALASAYFAARASRRPAALLLEGLRLRLGARTPEELRRHLEALAGTEDETGAAARKVVQALAGGPAPGEREVVRLSRAIDLVLEAAGGRPPPSS